MYSPPRNSTPSLATLGGWVPQGDGAPKKTHKQDRSLKVTAAHCTPTSSCLTRDTQHHHRDDAQAAATATREVIIQLGPNNRLGTIKSCMRNQGEEEPLCAQAGHTHTKTLQEIDSSSVHGSRPAAHTAAWATLCQLTVIKHATNTTKDAAQQHEEVQPVLLYKRRLPAPPEVKGHPGCTPPHNKQPQAVSSTTYRPRTQHPRRERGPPTP